MKVYVAGPYSTGNVEDNVREAISIADKVRSRGHTPFVPHLYHLWDGHLSHPYDYWMNLCLDWMVECDCVLRFGGTSPGAEYEIMIAKEQKIPVFYSVEELPVSMNSRNLYRK